MSKIVLTPEQLSVVAQSAGAVEVLDDQGHVLTSIRPLSPTDREAIEHYKRNRALNVTKYPAEQVEARLRKLEEIRQREGMDEAKMRDLLRRMRAGEQV